MKIREKYWIIICGILGLLFLCLLRGSERGKQFTPYHLEVSQGWSNDLQTIRWNELNQYYDVYFLHSRDGATNPFGPSGQDWQHVTTKDFIYFDRQEEAIPSQGGDESEGWKSAWTGSIISNRDGFFPNLPEDATLAYFSGIKKSDGSQNIWLAWSKDGEQFSQVLNNGRPLLETSVSSNQVDFRDPYVTYFQGKLLMYVAEGDVIGVYQSTDGLNWDKADKNGDSKILASTFFRGRDWEGNAPVECPVIKTMSLPTGEQCQVLFFGAKDLSKGETTGTYYTVGHLDANGLFIADEEAQRLDQGSDFYGANFSGSDSLEEVNSSLLTMAWVGNWNYTSKGVHINQDEQSPLKNTLGAYSLARRLEMSRDGKLRQSVVPSFQPFQSLKSSGNPIEVREELSLLEGDEQIYELLQLRDRSASEVYELQLSAPDLGSVYFHITQGESSILLTFDLKSGFYTVSGRALELDNGLEGSVASSYYYDGLLGQGKGYRIDSGSRDLQELTFRIYTDKHSIEFEMPNHQMYTVARFSDLEEQDFEIYSSNKQTKLKISNMKPQV